MSDINAFERQLSGEIAGLMGPEHPVDDAAIYGAITTTTQSPKWRFHSMFSATKFVVAGAIVALFGGFLLSGVLMQPRDEPLLPAAALASASPEAVPSVGPDTAPAQSVRSDLLPGVDLITEEVEPGVFRVLSDGERDLADPWPGKRQISARNVVTGQDGSVWFFRSNPDDDQQSSVFFRLGEPEEREVDWITRVADDAMVGPDGVMWFAIESRQQKVREPRLWSFDGAVWSDHTPAEGDGYVTGVEVASDGAVWTTWLTDKRRRMSAARWDGNGWQRLGRRVPADGQRQAGRWGHRVAVTDDGDVWLLPNGLETGLFRDSGSGWDRIDPPSRWTSSVSRVGRDGTLWTMLTKEPGRNEHVRFTTRLGRFDGEEWQVFGEGRRFPEFIDPFQGLPAQFEVADDGRVWLLNTQTEDEPGRCGGIVNFEGTSWTRLLDGLCAYDADLAPDGSLWLEAGEFEGPINTYVITPEAVAATE